MPRSDADFPVSITAAALQVPESTTTNVLKLAEGVLGDARGYLGPLHLGLMAVMADLGQLPTPARLRSSRDIAPIQHSLSDLETIGLTRPASPGLIALTDDAADALKLALDHHFAHAAADALGQLSRVDPGSWRAPSMPPPTWTWLRNLLTFLSYRGLRITGQGLLHRSDLRRFESICELPPRQFLDDCLAAGLGLDLFFAHDGQLIIGDGIDLVDLPPAALAREVLYRWVSGRIRVALQPVSAMAGLLSGWLEPLQSVELPTEGGSARLFRHAEDTDGLVEATLGPLPFDPVSGLMTGNPRREDLQAARVELLLTHRRIRAGLLTLVSALPRRTRLPLDTVCDLVHAHIALDHLRRPTRAPGRSGGAALFAGATQILPVFSGRVRENLGPWLDAMLVPTGLAEVRDDWLRLSPEMPPPPIPPAAFAHNLLPNDGVYQPPPLPPEGAPPNQAQAATGRMLVQPSGEVMVPPNASIHAIIHLACGAQPTTVDRAMTFGISRRSLMRLSDAGIDVTTWADMLAQLSGSGPLPSTIQQLVKDVARQQGEVTLAPAGGVLIARDPVRLQELMSYPRLAKHIVLRPAPNVIVLAADTDLQQFLSDLGDRGFSGLFVDRPDQGPQSKAS